MSVRYKPKDFKGAVHHQRLEEGDEQLILKIADAELRRLDIVRSNKEKSVAQPQGVDLKEHFDKIEELKGEIHKRDMLISPYLRYEGGTPSALV